MWIVRVILLLFACTSACLALTDDDRAYILHTIDTPPFHPPEANVERIRAMGPDALQPILERYRVAGEDQRAKIARLLWALGFTSKEATDLLLQDAKTGHSTLRINIQYALGSLSDDRIVVNTLLDNMRNDPNPLFRDKAACALAYDQVLLDAQQKYYLYRGLIEGLGDEKAQVRRIALQALKIQTGQTMGFAPDAPLRDRNASIARWQQWLSEYQQSI